MSAADMSRAAGVLRSLYQHVETLDKFADGIVFREGQRAVVIEESDTDLFKTFVRGIYVCRDKELKQVPSCNQICTLPELMAFILNSMKRRKKRNILVNGYNVQALPQEMRNADQFQYQGSVTQSACYIHGSDLWRKAATRLGTDITRYLLESCSMFVAVPPSCVFQVCGVPVYDRVSVTSASPGFYLQHQSRTRNGAPCTSYRHAGTVKRKWGIEHHIARKKKSKTDVKVKKRKRMKDAAQTDEGETVTHSTKRRRVGLQEATEEIRQVFCEPVEGGQSMSVEPTQSIKLLKGDAPASKHPVELQAREGAASWRSGMFPPLPPSQSFVRTLGFLYGGKGMRGFLLNRKIKCADGCRRLQGQDLIRIVFFEGLPYLNGLQKKSKKLPRRFFSMVTLFSRLLRQHRRCPYTKILQRMCPLLSRNGPGEGELSSLLSQHSAPHRVYLFIKECLSTVIPEELWGSEQNRLNFFVRVRVFLHSGKFERLSVAELMWKMKVNDCDWLKISKTGRVPPSELSYRTQILGQFLAWLLDGYVAGLVRACFYATESLGQKNALRFYKHDVWEKLQDLAFRDHLSKGQLEELTPAQVASLPKSTIISRLRFIPKTDSMRPITRVIGADAKTRNPSRVRDLFCVLRACVNTNPTLLGSTVWGMADIHKMLQSIAPNQKEMPQPLYFVKADVSGAYESLPHKKLIEVIDQALSLVEDKCFTIRCYAKIWADSYEGLKKTFVRQAYLLEPCGMKGFVMSLQRSGQCHDAVLVEQRFCSELRGKESKQFFIQMLTGSVIQFGKKTYRQCRGIPQGSVISSLLCCLCYGHMENVLFKDMMGKRGCLMRLVDDFLLITPDLHEAEWFLDTLLDGVPEYGLAVNPQKMAVNFPVLSRSRFCPSIQVLPSCCLFPWCGLLLDTYSLNVYKDYSSYAGLSLRYSLTLCSSLSAGQQMKRKLMAILRLKCHALFMNMKTNSPEAVYKNIYELLLLHAHRFHVCAQSLPFGQTVAKNPVYFLQIIWQMAGYTNHLLRISNKGHILGNKPVTGIMQYEAVELLFCLAFWLVLSKHRLFYKDLLQSLQKRKRRLEWCLGDLRLTMVRKATNPRKAVEFLAKLK
ncbi:telomerase reverse transcriptase [Antennarius striatus]|uniref:telomerase reverse transcriptase n=1 Tax=Antennarius striatus TaxID=241820 RepID=UPI0035AE16C9